MSKTKEELNHLKNEYEMLSNKLKELSNEELCEVVGGVPCAAMINAKGISTFLLKAVSIDINPNNKSSS